MSDAAAKDIPPDFNEAIAADDTLISVADFLEDACLLALMLTCVALRGRLIANDDFWQMRLATFAALYPGLAHLDRGEDEMAFHWYARWRQGLASAEAMALEHHAGRCPYMRVFGSFNDSLKLSAQAVCLQLDCPPVTRPHAADYGLELSGLIAI